MPKKTAKLNVLKEAKKRVDEARTEKAVALLEEKLQELEDAKIVIANIERELKDLELQIEHGSF
jgi:predicted negative regulator of RcsB-dependent stress response